MFVKGSLGWTVGLFLMVPPAGKSLSKALSATLQPDEDDEALEALLCMVLTGVQDWLEEEASDAGA